MAERNRRSGRRGNDIDYQVVRSIGILAEYSSGWTKEVNMISWNGGTAKYDIRDWAPDHNTMSRGITMHEDEVKALLEVMNGYFSRIRKKDQPRTRRPVEEEIPFDDPREEQVEAAEQFWDEEKEEENCEEPCEGSCGAPEDAADHKSGEQAAV